jgi:replicative superfamily II helicase
MSIPKLYIEKMLEKLSSEHIVNLITQADARRILQEVKETENNFPRFDSLLTEKATHIGYTLLSCGCSLIENDNNDGFDVLKKAGKLLSDTFSFNKKEQDNKDIHILIASLSLYIAKQYSYSFIIIKNIHVDFTIGQIIYNFIRKDLNSLMIKINEVMLSSHDNEVDQHHFIERIITFEIARVFSIIHDFIYSGNKEAFSKINDILNNILIIAYEDNLILYWLIIRLLKILFSTYHENSLWYVLPPLFFDNHCLNKYIQLLSNLKNPVTELWPSQIKSLQLATGNNNGAVINLRTSAGKTRIAEICILKTLSSKESSKVLYLAPFRSLAFEIEQNFDKIFTPLGISVSQLYGGATANIIDFELITESQIIIATPEKAKALIRCGSGIETELKLIIIDEGHLFSTNERDIRNEIFLTHVKEYADRNNIRILLLSAVLPNADELAQWISSDSSLVAKSDWKPSLERLGLLIWNGNNVRLEWRSDGSPFNPNFIQSKLLGFSHRRNLFPNNKSEAVAATAVKLSSNGTVLIYSARANSIKQLAKNVLLAMGEQPIDYNWDKTSWEVFQTICHEELDENDIVFNAAKKGIICHNDRLPTLVRYAIEKLMRSKSPLIIIASSTLGQGVNIGISTVIVYTPYYDRNPINHRDFWNICGRAGRAFSDIEGKILYAIDTDIESSTNEKQKDEKWKRIKMNYRLANNYFDNKKMTSVYSGISIGLMNILQNANTANINFENLLESIANDFFDSDNLSYLSEEINNLFYYIDDELLAMHEEFGIDDFNLDWIDDVFRKSLALIQAKNENIDEYLAILKARTNLLIKNTPNKINRKKIISSGIPYYISKLILEDIDLFKSIATTFMQHISNNENWIDAIANSIREIELWSNKNAGRLIQNIPEQNSLDNMRQDWISGTSLRRIRQFEQNADNISKDYYGFILPWIIHAISQMFDPVTDEIIVNLYSKLALFIELGLPNDTAVNIYLAGVHSRSATLELSELNIFKDKSISEVKRTLFDSSLDEYAISEDTKAWINLLSEAYNNKKPFKISFPKFSYKMDNLPERLYPRKNGKECFLVSNDGYFREVINSTDKLPFEKISNINGLYFEKKGDFWNLCSYNPFIIIE